MGYDGTLKFDTKVDHSGFQSGIDKISGIASAGLKTTIAVIGGAATAVAGIGTAAIKVGAEFEAAMSNVAAISGATGSELEALTDKAKEMGAKTKFSATESAQAFSYMAMAGWKTADMLEGIEGIMNLAAASGEDLASTSDIVTDALTAFGLSAKDSTHFADILAAASSNANTNVGLMGETFKYVAPVAGALGFSAEDCATAIGLMANSGIKASQAGTSLRSIFTKMSKPTKDVQSAMDKLGISITKSDGSMKSLNEIMVDLRKGFSGLTEAEKAQMAATIGGQEAMSGLLAIVNASDEDFEKLQDSIYGCDGAAAAMAETMQDNLAGQITILKSGLEGLGIALYESVQEPMKDVVKEAQTMVQEITAAFEKDGLEGMVEKTGEILAEVAVEIADAAPALINAALTLCKSFINSIISNKEDVARAGVELVTSLVTAILSFAGDFWSAAIELFAEFLSGMAEEAPKIGEQAGEMVSQLASALLENVPVIIDAGKEFIRGFLDGLSEELPGVSALLSGFFDGYLSTLETIAGGVVDVVSALFDAINKGDPETLEAIGKAIGTIAAAMAGLSIAGKVVSGIQSLFSVLGIFKGFAKGFSGIIGKVVEGLSLWSGGAGTFGEVLALQFPKIAAFGTKIGSMVSAVTGFISKFGATFAGIASIVAGAIMAVTNFVDMFKNGFSVVKDILMGVGIALAAVGAVILGAPALVAAAVAGIVFAVANLVIVIKDHWGQIVEFFKGIPAKIGEVIGSIVEWFQKLPEKASEVTGQVVQFFSGLPGKISEWLSNVITSITEWGSQLYENFCSVVSTAIDAVVQFFSDLPYKIGYALGYVIGKLIDFGAKAINWVITTVPQIIEKIVTFFSELPGKIWTWLTNTFNKLVQWGSQSIQKAGEIAKNCVESISNFFSQLPGKIYTWLTNALSNLKTWGSNMLSSARTAASNVINAVVNFFSQLPGKIWTWLQNTIQKVVQWGTNMVAKGRQAASDLVSAVVNGVSSLPSKMWQIGSNIVSGVWNGIKSAAGWFTSSVKNFFSGIVNGAKSALGIHSPSKVFADEIGRWIPPGIGKGIEAEMPELTKDTQDEMKSLSKKMKAAVQIETGTIKIEKNANETYKVKLNKGESFSKNKTEVIISGETHVHVDLDGEQIAEVSTPLIDKKLGRRFELEERGV
ncbi:MAG: phage tail tape measure protein [Blautia sp.]